MYDVIVIGAGHNGLSCAAYLARAGRKTLVLEERDVVGGFCTTEETIASLPKFKFCPTSLDVSTGNIQPSVFDELGLEKHGLKWIWPDPIYSYVHPDGRSLAFWRDYRRTCKEIEAFSKKDAQNYAALTEIFTDVWKVASPYLMGHPTRPGMATVAETLRRAAPRVRNLSRAARLLMSAPGPVLDEWFESPIVKAALACYSAGGVVSIDEPMSGLIMSIMALQHEWGMRRPIGGVGEITRALRAEVETNGGEVIPGCRVSKLLHESSRICGVVTESGREYRAREVIGAIDPITLFKKLMPSELMPDDLDREIRGIGVYRNNFASFRADVALDRPLELIVGHERTREIEASCMLFAPDVAMVRRAGSRVSAGIITAETPYWIAVPSAIDRTLVPGGSGGETLYVFLPEVPARLGDGVSWHTIKDRVLDDVLSDFEQYAPGVSKTVIGRVAHSPEDLTQFSAVHQGHLFHVDMSTAQMGPWRPTPKLAGYQSPVAGLWHTGAGSHPFGTLCGWPGRSAARHLLRKTKQ